MSSRADAYTGCLFWVGVVVVVSGFVALGLAADWRLSVLGSAAVALAGLLVLFVLGTADVGPWTRVVFAALVLLAGAGLGLLLGPRPRLVWAAVIVAFALVVLVLTIRSRAGIGGWALFAVFFVLLGSGVWSGLLEPELLTSNEERAALDALAEGADEFAAATGAPSDRRPQLRGRVVPVDQVDGTVEAEVYIRLPDELQARSPDEASTVVLLRYGDEVVGDYGGNGEAIQLFVRITIIDLVAEIRYEGHRIDGVPPPARSAYGESQTGDPPAPQAIADYLTGLPRRPARSSQSRVAADS